MSDDLKVRRGEDLDISFMGMRLRGGARAVVSLLNGSIGTLALAAVIVWHAYESKDEATKMLEAIWFQTIALVPKEARAEVIRKAGDKIPPGVRAKLGEKQ